MSLFSLRVESLNITALQLFIPHLLFINIPRTAPSNIHVCPVLLTDPPPSSQPHFSFILAVLFIFPSLPLTLAKQFTFKCVTRAIFLFQMMLDALNPRRSV